MRGSRGEAVEISPDAGGRRITFKAACIAVALAALPLLYVPSMGPRLWLSDHGYLSDSVRQLLSRIYEPPWVVARSLPFTLPMATLFVDGSH